jgi:hypothetical protein
MIAKPRLASFPPREEAFDEARRERERLRSLALMSMLGHK